MTEYQNPTLWKLLPASDAADHARADQHARWQAGTPLPAEKYLDALPRVAADPELAMLLIYGEVLSRTDRGESPTLDEYRRRFPHLADRLALQFQLHSAVGKASDPLSTDPADRTRPITAGTGGESLPERFGPFLAREVIGRGGMGVVLAAFDPALDREVAIKTLRPGRTQHAEAAVRFGREARISAKVQHPAVPPVYAVGELPDGTPYLAMKLVRGRMLAELFKDRPDPSADLPRLVRAFEQVCQAVGYAHTQGVIHRDLKPANVMVGEFGEVQVMDWGLAREFLIADFRLPIEPPGGLTHPNAGEHNRQSTIENRQSPELTHAGTVLGTPAYMAPEQARGESADARADVFALGAVLCELLTGRPPFAGKTGAEVLAKAAAADLAAARQRLAGCGADAELVALAERCLQPTPADRPPTAAAVADAIADYHAATDERLRAAERSLAATEARMVEGRRKRRWQSTTAFAVAALVAAGGMFAVEKYFHLDGLSVVAVLAAAIALFMKGYNQKAMDAVGAEAAKRENDGTAAVVGAATPETRPPGDDPTPAGEGGK